MGEAGALNCYAVPSPVFHYTRCYAYCSFYSRLSCQMTVVWLIVALVLLATRQLAFYCFQLRLITVDVLQQLMLSPAINRGVFQYRRSTFALATTSHDSAVTPCRQRASPSSVAVASRFFLTIHPYIPLVTTSCVTPGLSTCYSMCSIYHRYTGAAATVQLVKKKRIDLVRKHKRSPNNLAKVN